MRCSRSRAARPSAHGQTLALAYHQGDVYKYSLHSTEDEKIGYGANNDAHTFDLTADETVTVQLVDAVGSADLAILLNNLTFTASYQGVPNTSTAAPSHPFDITVAADGHILSVKGDDSGANPFTMFSGINGSFVSAVLPAQRSTPATRGPRTMTRPTLSPREASTSKTTSKYLRDESLQGLSAAVIETHSSSSVDLTISLSNFLPLSATPSADQSITAKGTFASDVTTWVDPAGHRVLKTQLTGATRLTMTTPGIAGPVTIKGAVTNDLTLA